MYIGEYISRGTAAAITWASRASGLRMQEAGIVRYLIAEGEEWTANPGRTPAGGSHE
jgi:hypothetical protein